MFFSMSEIVHLSKHLILIFELLDMDLKEYIRQNKDKVNMKDIKVKK